jgi:hypothetical protein
MGVLATGLLIDQLCFRILGILMTRIGEVRFAPMNGRRRLQPSGQKSADIVPKVENRATRKVSRKLIFGLLRRCVAFQRHYGGPWSILDETIWFLTSPLVKRISGSEKFRSSPQKDFATISTMNRQRHCLEFHADLITLRRSMAESGVRRRQPAFFNRKQDIPTERAIRLFHFLRAINQGRRIAETCRSSNS